MEQDGRPPAPGEATDPPIDTVDWDQRVEPAPPVAGESLAATIAALADPATRSPRPDTCPFLRALDASGATVPPFERPDAANRCVAVGEPSPQSARQQQLVCLTLGHSNCPRYLRGALVAADSLAPPAARSPSAPVVASVLILVAATAMSVGFLLVRGGFDLPMGAPGGSQLAAATLLPSPSPAATTVLSSAAPASLAPVEPTVAVTPSAAPATPAPTPAPTAPPTPAPTPSAAPTSSRYALLDPCPATPNCWVYTVRPGDNLRSIVNYFGVQYDTVLDMNPQIRDPTNIHAGDRIRMPPPTR